MISRKWTPRAPVSLSWATVVCVQETGLTKPRFCHLGSNSGFTSLSPRLVPLFLLARSKAHLHSRLRAWIKSYYFSGTLPGSLRHFFEAKQKSSGKGGGAARNENVSDLPTWFWLTNLHLLPLPGFTYICELSLSLSRSLLAREPCQR